MHSPKKVFTTMITPFTSDNKVDYAAVDLLVEWYWTRGCDGIFAVCQSSEAFFLSLEEKVSLARRVKDKADELSRADKSRPPMTVIASGHTSDTREEQSRELCAMADTGVEAVILISNRLDVENRGDSAWIRECEALIKTLPAHVDLGVYECPHPDKRLMSEPMLRWCADTGRFKYMKDTCCDASLIKRRLEVLEGSGLELYNANAQTLLQSLRDGAAGYCGVMANFHPQLYVRLCRTFEGDAERAELLQSYLCMAAFSEGLGYPVSAKYYLSALEGIPMELYSRARGTAELSEYNRSVLRQMKVLGEHMGDLFG